MKRFVSDDFRSRLEKIIGEIECNSQAEVVVIIKPHSGDYADLPLLAGTVSSVISLTLLMFLPQPFSDITIYFGTIAALLGFLVLVRIIPSLQRRMAGRTRLRRNTDIMSRAVFQKGGMHHTRNKIAILFYVSIFEQDVRIVADKGAQLAVHQEDWETVEKRFRNMFTSDKPDQYLLEALQECVPVFHEHIPPVENDLQELPDLIDVRF